MKAIAAVLACSRRCSGCRSASAAAWAVPDFDHVVVIVFENKETGRCSATRDAPDVQHDGARATRSSRTTSAVSHPSLPNYLALSPARPTGSRAIAPTADRHAPSLADTLERSGRTWKAYAEGLPRPGFTRRIRGHYAKKHVPFLYFRAIAPSSARRAHVVPLTQLTTDLASERCPTSPSSSPTCATRCTTARSGPAISGCDASSAAAQAAQHCRLRHLRRGRTHAGGGHVPALVSARRVRRNAASRRTHYSLLRTIEHAWGLPLLGRSARAKPITGIWR